MVGDVAVPSEQTQVHARRAPDEINWPLTLLMLTVLIAGIAGVVVAMTSGLPQFAIVIGLVTGAIFAGALC